MKPLIETVQYKEESFVYAGIHTTPFFEFPWHQHIEYELIQCEKVSGMTYIGNYVGVFEEGDIYFIGSNTPHCFEKKEQDILATAIVIQFNKALLGEAFNELRECRSLKILFQKSLLGIKIQHKKDKVYVGNLIQKITQSTGLKRLILLLDCLDYISKIIDLPTLTNEGMFANNTSDAKKIDKVLDYTINHSQNKITLSDVAEMTFMSVPAFCKFFKQSTRKSYIQYLNEVRVNKACQLLQETDWSINEIAYQCGYNTLANFHKQFLKIKGSQPLVYKKQFLAIGKSH